MESHGTPGHIQITRATHELIENEFVCEPRGTVSVKGKGEMETWYLVGPKPGPRSTAGQDAVTSVASASENRIMPADA